MFDAFNAQPKNIGELLSDTLPAKIVVPRFQRGYSWEKKHVEAFWNDISTFRKESAKKGGPDKYFLGPIVVMSKSKDAIFLLDGQQRLATATILFDVLRDLAHTLNTTNAEAFAQDIQNHLITKEDIGSSLELGELDQAYFAATIQAYPPTAYKQTLRSHRGIQKARDILVGAVKTNLANLNPADALSELKAIRKTIRTDLVMASIPVASERDAFRIFETLNDRGLRLSVPDLLLNYLMGQADSDTARNTVREYWNDMVEGMGKKDINRFLRHMWVSKYGDLKNIDLFTALKSHIEEKGITSVDFAQSCGDECGHYIDLLNADTKNIGDAAPYVNTLVRELEVESSLPLLLAAYQSFSLKELETITRWLLVFVARYSIVVKLDASGMETVFFKLARDVRTKMLDKKNAKTCLADIKKTLNDNSPTDGQIKESVRKLLLDQEEAVYILSRIARHLQTGTKEIALGETNLEHIFPKKPSAEWKNADKLEPFLWHLGNLTMLGKRLNTSAASKGYKKKKVDYKKSELVMTQQLAKNFKDWNKQAVETRAESLSPNITEIWNFDNPSRA